MRGHFFRGGIGAWPEIGGAFRISTVNSIPEMVENEK